MQLAISRLCSDASSVAQAEAEGSGTAKAAALSGSAGREPRARSRSMAVLRASAESHVIGLDREGSNTAALSQTLMKASCKASSASLSVAEHSEAHSEELCRCMPVNLRESRPVTLSHLRKHGGEGAAVAGSILDGCDLNPRLEQG